MFLVGISYMWSWNSVDTVWLLDYVVDVFRKVHDVLSNLNLLCERATGTRERQNSIARFFDSSNCVTHTRFYYVWAIDRQGEYVLWHDQFLTLFDWFTIPWVVSNLLLVRVVLRETKGSNKTSLQELETLINSGKWERQERYKLSSSLLKKKV